MHDFTRLDVYRDAVAFAIDIAEFTTTLPRSERFGLAQQLRRASVSIAANLAEGAGRGDRKDFARYVRISLGSVCEVDCQLEIAVGCGFGDADTAKDLRQDANRLRRRLHAFERAVAART